MRYTHTDRSLDVATAVGVIVTTVLAAASVWMGTSVVRLVGADFAAGLRAISLGGF